MPDPRPVTLELERRAVNTIVASVACVGSAPGVGLEVPAAAALGVDSAGAVTGLAAHAGQMSAGLGVGEPARFAETDRVTPDTVGVEGLVHFLEGRESTRMLSPRPAGVDRPVAATAPLTA